MLSGKTTFMLTRALCPVIIFSIQMCAHNGHVMSQPLLAPLTILPIFISNKGYER